MSKLIKMFIIHCYYDDHNNMETCVKDQTEWEEVSEEDFKMYKKLCDAHGKYQNPHYLLIEKPPNLTLDFFKKEIENLNEAERAMEIKQKLNKEKRDKEKIKRDLKAKQDKEKKEKATLEKLALKLGVKILE